VCSSKDFQLIAMYFNTHDDSRLKVKSSRFPVEKSSSRSFHIYLFCPIHFTSAEYKDENDTFNDLLLRFLLHRNYFPGILTKVYGSALCNEMVREETFATFSGVAL